MKKDTSHIIKRAEHFQVILIGEGLMVGAVAGLIVLLYRILLGQAGTWLSQILKFVEGSTIKIIVWFAVLAVLAWIVSKLVDWEPMISGSGIPQLEGNDRENKTSMVASVANKIYWRILITYGWSCFGKGRSFHSAWCYGR